VNRICSQEHGLFSPEQNFLAPGGQEEAARPAVPSPVKFLDSSQEVQLSPGPGDY
jgi:hypothetical protein